MINYIFEMLAFIAAMVMYVRGDTFSMIFWLAATCVFGIAGTICDCVFRKYKNIGG